MRCTQPEIQSKWVCVWCDVTETTDLVFPATTPLKPDLASHCSLHIHPWWGADELNRGLRAPRVRERERAVNTEEAIDVGS